MTWASKLRPHRSASAAMRSRRRRGKRIVRAMAPSARRRAVSITKFIPVRCYRCKRKARSGRVLRTLPTLGKSTFPTRWRLSRGLHGRKPQPHVVGRPAAAGAAEVRPELRAHSIQQRRGVARGGEEAPRERLEPVTNVPGERRRARDERDRPHAETVRLEPRAVLVVAGEVPGLDAALVDALARERSAQRGHGACDAAASAEFAHEASAGSE